MENMNQIIRPNTQPESSTNDSPSAGNVAMETLDGEAEIFEGRVSEIAGDQNSEEWSGKSSQSSQTQQSTQGDDATQLSERQSLRERLLKHAPKAPAMRQEIRTVLEERKAVMEKDLRHYERNKEYHLLSQAIQQLRAIARQMEALAHASYELLKEIWLKVVYKLA